MDADLPTDLFPEVLTWLRDQEGVEYADCRREAATTQDLRVKNGEVEAFAENRTRGYSVRVLAGGSWGFAASSEWTPEAVRETAGRARAIAQATAITAQEKVRLAPVEPVQGTYATPVVRDPFQVDREAKIALLQDACAVLRADPRIRAAVGMMDFRRIEKELWTTEGTHTHQTILLAGGGIEATAIENGEAQRRSYPNSFDGDYAQRGYEFVEGMDLVEHAERVREEAVMLLDAPPCPQGPTTLILESSQLALQVHESCGHPIELDRVMGTEISFAGGSFLSLDRQGTFPYGSEQVTILADATLEGGMGSFGWDDEGVPAQRFPVVERGIFKEYLSSRETAARLGRSSTGAMRADGWSRVPLIRMINVNLEPGQGTLEELIADTRQGLLLETNKSWSIDDLRLHFQFGCELAWEIQNGKKVRAVRNPVYSGITPHFWRACDAVCGPEEWRLWGVPNCGKGEPMQTMYVGHGAAPARFRQVQVGVSG